MGIDRPIAHQAEAVIDIQISPGLGKQLTDPSDLVVILRKMAVNVGIGICPRESPRTGELFVG